VVHVHDHRRKNLSFLAMLQGKSNRPWLKSRSEYETKQVTVCSLLMSRFCADVVSATSSGGFLVLIIMMLVTFCVSRLGLSTALSQTR